MKKILLSFLVLSVGVSSYAQRNCSIHLSVDGLGVGAIDGTKENLWDIRQTFDSHSSYESDYLTSKSLIKYLSIKPEFRFSDKLSLYTGLQYTYMRNCFLGEYENGFFYVRSNQNAEYETNLFRLKNIEETAGYLSIPIEVKYTPLRFQGFNFYGRLGLDFGVNVHSKRSAKFFQAEMQQYEADVLNIVPFSPNKLLVTTYVGIGMGYKFTNGVALSADMPTVKRILTEKHSSIIKVDFLTGIQLSLSIPLINKESKE